MPRCCDCGFLSFRKGEFLVEATLRNRIEAKPALRPDSTLPVPLPVVCFALAARLDNEIVSSSYIATINRERECDSYVGWRQGFSPREHAEMYDAKLAKQESEARLREDREFHRSMIRSANFAQILGASIQAVATIAVFVLGLILATRGAK